MPAAFGLVDGSQALVELVEGVNFRDRDQMRPAEPATLMLDATLLVRAFLTGHAVERVEAVVRPERRPPLRLDTSAAEADPVHRRFEVVVADVPRRHPAQHPKRLRVALH